MEIFDGLIKRRTHDHAAVPTLATCPNCGATVIYHRVCPECGYYRGRQIVVKGKVRRTAR
ncbi:MAG: 50S ribosomal protein L32 [Bacteroidales bacterium]|nr:50S ribosomal protein L32 [Bacteroidales bacterium]MBR5956603.1 50S ribosomal protein L32 [Bacteroidales bacterium]